MFKRIIYDDWAGFVPELSFWLTFGVFLVIAVRAILLKKSKVQDLSELPFQENTEQGKSSMSIHDEPETDFSKEELPEGIILKEHSYDGIHEYDQRLPKWWMVTLLGAMLFAVIYWTVYDPDAEYVGGQKVRLDEQLAEIQAAKLANSIDVTNNDLFWEMSDSTQFVAAGEGIFQANCAACHGAELEGGIGFNLVDAEWVHGGLPSEIYGTIYDGVPEKGMQAWGTLLGQKRIAEVVAFVLSKNPSLRQ